MKIKISIDIIKGSIFGVVGVFLLLVTPSQVSIAHEETVVTSRTFPQIVFGIMVVCSVILILKGIFGKNKEYVSLEIKTIKAWLIPLGFLAIVIVYIYLMSIVGYMISSIIAVNTILVFLKCKKWHYYLITNATVFIIYYVFILLLKVQLPGLTF